MHPMRLLLIAVALGGVLAVPSSTRADDESLEATAARTKREREERRAKATKPVRAFSDADLRGTGGAPPPAEADPKVATAKGDEAPAGDQATEKTDDQIRAEKRATIQKKIDAEKTRIEDIDRGMARAQTELADITNYTYGAYSAALQKVLDDGKADKDKAQQTIEGLQEEARRLGVSVSP
jgi:uncharacterized membrane protein YqiK